MQNCMECPTRDRKFIYLHKYILKHIFKKYVFFKDFFIIIIIYLFI